MHRDKIVARIILIFSLANIALAAPAVRERHLDVADAAPEKRAGSDNEATDGSSHQDSALDLPSDSSHQDSSSTSPAASYHEGSHVYDPAYFRQMRPLSWWMSYDDQHSTSDHDSAPVSPSGSFSHSGSTGSMPELVSDSEESVNSPEPESPFGSSQHGPAPESLSGWMPHLGTVGSMPELISNSEEPANLPEPVSHSSPNPLAPEDLDDKSHYLTPPELPSTHGDSVPVSVNPSRLDDSAPDLSAASTHDNLLAPVSANPSTPDYLAPESGTPPLHNDLPPESGTPQLHDDLPPQGDMFFNDALKQNLKVFAGLGTIVGVSAGLVYGLQKLIKGTDPQAYVSALFPPTFNQVTNNLTYDLPQSTRWPGSCKW
jgi:hypothetical protein